MPISKGKNSRTVQGTDDANSSRVSTAELVDFVKEQALRRPIKEVARLTGLSEKAVVNIRSGQAAASGQTLSTWCRNDAGFRAEYFAWCGGKLQFPPEITATLAKLASWQENENAVRGIT